MNEQWYGELIISSNQQLKFQPETPSISRTIACNTNQTKSSCNKPQKTNEEMMIDDWWQMNQNHNKRNRISLATTFDPCFISVAVLPKLSHYPFSFVYKKELDRTSSVETTWMIPMLTESYYPTGDTLCFACVPFGNKHIRFACLGCISLNKPKSLFILNLWIFNNQFHKVMTWLNR